MFDHVSIRVSDRAASERFYDRVLAALGVERTYTGTPYTEWDDFGLGAPDAEHRVTRRLHVAFAAPTRGHVDAFWRAGTDEGYAGDGEPGPRPQYRDDYYGAFLLDPDGNSVEAVHHGALREGGVVDHLWLRVRDVEAATGFWATVAPHAGLRVQRVDAGRTHVLGPTGSLSVVPGAPTEGLHVAFPAGSRGPVEAFHAAAVAAGYRDNGGPGERPEYHPGYYGAFVLDPDGTNVEVVFHDRR